MHILIGGDSFTDHSFKSIIKLDHDSRYPKWPHYLKTRAKITNAAKSGDCNVKMIDNVLDILYKNPKVDHVIIALSDWLRFSTPMMRFNYVYYAHTSMMKENIENENQFKIIDQQAPFFEAYPFNEVAHSFTLIDITLRKIYDLWHVCAYRGIKLHVFQMLKAFGLPNRKLVDYTLARYYMNRPIFKELDKLDRLRQIDLIGWPFVESLGGEYADTILKDADDKYRWRVGEEDMHPNAEGHKRIAEWVNAKIKI